MKTLDNDEMLKQFELRILPVEQWDHLAHLRVCRAALDRFGPDEAFVFLRRAIHAYNEATGTPNTDSSGYHETLTRYYVEAVWMLGPCGTEAMIVHPTCTRDAPLRHWSRPLLFSAAARLGWVEPDLVPIAKWESRRPFGA